MKNRILFICLVGLLFSACTKVNEQTLTIEKNCTGVYLEQNGQFFYVCNDAILKDFEDGDKISVSYKKINKCGAENTGFICHLAFPNHGNIKVLKIQ